MEKIKFVFFGTGDFGAKILKILLQNSFVPELVVTSPDKLKGRKMELQPSSVKQQAQKNNIKIITDYSLLITDYYDLFIVADYGKIIPKEILDIPKYGSLNIHPSLLPKFRGSSPIQSFILSGEKETGVTIILMDEKMDHGPIVAQANLEALLLLRSKASKLYYKELEEKLAELGGELLVKIIPDWIDRKINPQPQNHLKATYTQKITKEDGLIKLGEPAKIIERKVRAFTPWPGAHFFLPPPPTSLRKSGGLIRVIITEAEIKDSNFTIKKIKPEGKNEMLLRDFLRGNQEFTDILKPYLSC